MDHMISLLMTLIRHRLCPDTSADSPEVTIDAKTIQKLMHIARMHSLSAIVGSALIEQNTIPSKDMQASIEEYTCQCACHHEIMQSELKWLCNILETAQIPFIPLKGAVIQCFYPEPWLRTSGDIDILIPESFLDKAVSILLENGCKKDRNKRFHDIPLVTPGGVLLELHFNLREDIAVMDNVLDKVWEYSQPVPGKLYEHRQDNAFLIFHLLAHTSYHLIGGGCGIRSFIDIWLLQNQLEFDNQLFHTLCCESQLEIFYNNVNQLIGVWFENKNHTNISKRLEQLVINGGTFGSFDNRVLIEQTRHNSKLKHILHRVFKPYHEIKNQFPILEQKPWLTPVYQVLRWIRVFTGGRLGHVVNEYQTSQHHPKAQISDTKLLLKEIGLYFK